MTRWTFTIPLDTPSQNKLYASADHRWGRVQYRKYRDIAEMVALSSKIPKATGPRLVRWTRVLGPRQRYFDEMNFIGGLKPACDGLVLAKLLVDDRPKYYRGEYDQDDTRRGEGPCLEVTISE